MPIDYTVIVRSPWHYGNDRNAYGDDENSEFVGPTGFEFTFNCPDIDPRQTAFLLFQTYDVNDRLNIIRVNGVDVLGNGPDLAPPVARGNLPSGLSDRWCGNVMLLDTQHRLQPTENTLSFQSRNSGGGSRGNVDDFIIDNV